MVNIVQPVPGGDVNAWAAKLNAIDAALNSALTDTDTKATSALAASTTAVTTANAVSATASSAATSAAAAATAASSATTAATNVATALNAHKTDGDPHPQYLNNARADLRYIKQAGVSGASTSASPVLTGSASSLGVNFTLAFSPYGLRSDGTSYYDANGVPAGDRAYPAVQADGSVRLVKVGQVSSGPVDLVPPTLSAISSTVVSSTSANATVTSNESATAVLEYGTTTSYGSTVTTGGTNTVFTYSMVNLTASTAYHYRWRVTDLAGNLTISSDNTFTTSAAPSADPTLATFHPSGFPSEQISMFAADLSSANHWVESAVSGISDDNKNAAVIVRGNSSGSQGIRLGVNKHGWIIIEIASTLQTSGTWAGPGATNSGVLRGEVIGNTAAIYWNGSLVTSQDIATIGAGVATNKRPGLGILQDAASAVTMASNHANISTATSGPPLSGGSAPTAGQAGYKAYQLFGPTRSGLPWHSGAYVGGTLSTSRCNYWSTWRGSVHASPSDFATVYPAYATWGELQSSGWVTDLVSGFAGKLNYGLPMLPSNQVGNFYQVTSGYVSANDAFDAVATSLKNANRGDSMIRVGLECNGNWYPWSVNWSTNTDFINAFRAIVTRMRAIAPNLKFAYCWSAGATPQGMPSGTSPAAQLERFYPGDAYVDAIECDTYDFYQIQLNGTDASWNYHQFPLPAAGIGDVAAYARAKGKALWLGEWGLHDVQGPGDDPFFINKMWSFCVANADILAGECYFNERDSYIANSIWDFSGENENPNSGAAYKLKWGRPDLYPTGA